MAGALPFRWVLAATLAAGLCPAQSLDDARDFVRDSLRDVHFAKSFAGLVLMADELELSAANYRFDNESDTELTVLALPFQRTLRPWGEDAIGLHVEGALGYARARERTDDLYGGTLPGAETAVEVDWTTWGGLVGVGPVFDLGPGLTFAPIANLGLSRLESDAHYSGPGAGLSASLFDGIAFNWDALALSGGAAARVDWRGGLGGELEFELIGRYDLRWTQTIDAEDEAQEFSERTQLLTLRGDLVGPTGLRLLERPLRWRGTVGYRRALEGSLYGCEEMFLLGGGVELATAGELPLFSNLSLSGAAIFGDGVTGWTVGLGFSF
jgi:hypothetical protein